MFGHFIETVIGLPPHPGLGRDFRQPPRDRWPAKIISYVLPYLLVAGTLYTGVYLLFRALRGFLTNEIARRSVAEDGLLVVWTRNHFGVPVGPANALIDVILNVTGITCLLTAMTLGARIPRLTRTWRWQVIAACLFVGFSGFYVLLVDAPRRSWLGFHAVGTNFQAEDAWWPTARTLALALGASLLAVVGGRLRASALFQPLLHGMRPLLIPGVLSVAFVAVFRLAHADRAVTQSLWPLLLGGAAFTYLWWLAALLFDLVFVWHRYIRFATLQTHLRTLARQGQGACGDGLTVFPPEGPLPGQPTGEHLAELILAHGLAWVLKSRLRSGVKRNRWWTRFPSRQNRRPPRAPADHRNLPVSP